MVATKKVSESYTTQIHIIMQEHINGQKRMFGGRLMEWIDVVAAVVARRHSGCQVTTACVDRVEFKNPAHLNSTLIIEGRITYVGKTSMEIRVDTFTESLSGKRTPVTTAYLVMVAIDEDGNPVSVPRLELETVEQRKEFDNGVMRNSNRKKFRAEGLY